MTELLPDWAAHERERYNYLYNNNYPRGPRVADEIIKLLDTKDLYVLDVGCGHGSLAKELPFNKYSGIDVSDVIIDKNKNKFKNAENVFFYSASAENMPFYTDECDLVVTCDILEHIPHDHIESVLKEIKRVGNHSYHAVSCRESVITDKDGNPLHLIVESPEWWVNEFKRAGFKIINCSSTKTSLRVFCDK